MKSLLRLLLTASLSASLPVLVLAADRAPSDPAPATYLLTNDDGTVHSYVSFFTPGGTQNAPTLNFGFNVNAVGLGIGGGYFALSRVAVSPDTSAPCAYASNSATGDIVGINITNHTSTGTFSGSQDDAGDTNGIGLVLNSHYLYASYSTSNTIGTFSIQPGCQLSFLSDIPAAGLNGGSVAGMALHGNILVVAYADGSIESFNTSNGIPVPNGDAQNSTGFQRLESNLPEGVDITSDGHYAVFGDSSTVTTVEVSDISSGKLTPTAVYVLGARVSAVGATARQISPGVNSGTIRLSPDESMIYLANNDGGAVTAAFFNRQTGSVALGCVSRSLAGFFNPWGFTGGLATRDNTGTGGVLYVAEYEPTTSSIGVVTINSNGTTCTLTESSASEVPDPLSNGLLSIATYPPRAF